jgi:MraZ protein
MMFIGEHTAKLDDKGRLVFPAPLKALAEREGKGRFGFVVKKNQFRLCLEMVTEEEWKRQSEEIRAQLKRYNRKHDLLWDHLMRDRAFVEPDEKMGRIQIPKSMLEMIDVRKEVVFAGNDYKIEVWAKEHYKDTQLSEEELTALAEEILG